MPTIGFPLLLIPLAIYNIFVFLMPGVALTAPVMTLRLMSGAEWPVTFGDVMLALGLVLLLFEVIKGSRPGAKYVTDHILSLLAFGGALAEFLLLAPFGTSTFFLLTVLTAVDFLAGTSIALRQRQYRRMRDAADEHEEAPLGAVPDRPIAAELSGSWGPEPLKHDVPPIEKISPAEHEATNSPRKVSDWNMSDLVHDAKMESGKSASNADDAAADPSAIKPPLRD